jgi:hypothetical protein
MSEGSIIICIDSTHSLMAHAPVNLFIHLDINNLQPSSSCCCCSAIIIAIRALHNVNLFLRSNSFILGTVDKLSSFFHHEKGQRDGSHES